jgi:ABC transporter fused permease/ATP-binding protein
MQQANSQQDEQKPKLNKRSLSKLRVLLRYVRPYRRQFVLGLIFLVFSSLTTLVFPKVIGDLVDSALRDKGSGYFGSIDQLALFLLAILGVQAVFSFLRIYLFVTVSERSLADLRKDLYSRMLHLPMQFFSKHRVGELSSRIASDISLIKDTFSTTLAEMLRGAANLVLGIGLILFISPRLTLLMVVTFPLLIIAAIYFGRFIRKISKTVQDRLADTNTVVEETLQGIQNVKAFANERHEISRYNSGITSMVNEALRGARYRGLFSSFVIFAVFGTIVLIMWYGAGLIRDDLLTVGELTSFLIYTTFVGAAAGSFGEQFSQLQRTIGATERIQEILGEEQEPLQLNPAQETPLQLKGSVAFQEVHFSYPGREDVEVIRGMNFAIAPGQKTALVGTSGAGKSTIVSLILRFYDPDSGQVLIDGQPARAYDLTSLRRQMALVPQDVILFGGSIRENIAYGDLHADEEAIREAARQANAHDFIEAFPEGYDTVVGERGVKLSGGQKQRIAIARAILRDPAILILDEATSSLDSESEQLVQAALENLMAGRTAIIIAHRLSTIRDADQILVLRRGQIAEQGTHTELMAHENGIYRSLASLQLEDPAAIGPAEFSKTS